MPVHVSCHPAALTPLDFAEQPSIVVGITSPSTCPVLKGRLRALRDAGFRVTLICSPGERVDQIAASEGVRAVAVPIERQIAPISDLLAFLRICLLLRRLRPAIVEFSTPKAGLLGTIAAWLCNVRCRVYMLRGLKLEAVTGFKRQVLLAAEKLAAACAHVVLCNSDSLRERALMLGVAPASKFVLLGDGSSNGVDIEQYSPGESDVRLRYNLPPGAPVVGFVGRLTRDKGLPELIEAFDEILRAEPETHLLLVGWFDEAEDQLEPELRTRIASHPRIHMTGSVV